MAYIYVDETIQLQWQEFSADSVSYVRLYYKIGAAAEVFISNSDNSYSTAVDANADGLNRHQYDLSITSDMIGDSVTFIIKDGTEDNIELVAAGPHDVYLVEEKVDGLVWTIEWSDIVSDTVDIYYRIDGGSWVLIESGVTNHTIELGAGSYDWTIDSGPCDSIEIRILDVENDVELISPIYSIIEGTSITGTGSISVSDLSVLTGIGNISGQATVNINATYRNWYIRSYKRNNVTPNIILNKNKQKRFSIINNTTNTIGVFNSIKIIPQVIFDDRIVNSTRRKVK